jgi:hypothetical protein
MKRNKTSISKADSYTKIGDFWDTHDLANHWDQGKDVEFEVNIDIKVTAFSRRSPAFLTSDL